MLEKDRSLDTLVSVPKSKFTFEALRKPLGPATDAENRNTQPSDILLRAKNMGMKIWGLDKLKRILDVMFEDPAPSNASISRGKPSNTSSKATQSRPQDLQQLISNEQLNGPIDRDAKGVYNELTTFKGPYIYVRCCFERVRPVMVREWSKVANREDGDWPQFRSVSSGKCPFIEEDPRVRKPPPKGERENTRQVAKDAMTSRRAKPSPETTQMQPPAVVGRKRTLAEIEGSNKPQPVPRQQLPPRCKDDGLNVRPGTSQGSVFPARSGLIGGEPMASGMQASNITSAIRSQIISSTAAAPGAKAATSREMHGLQRKVLGRAQGPGSALSRSTGMTNLAAATDPEVTGPGTRAAKQRAQERLGQSRLAQVLENPAQRDDEPETERAEAKQKVKEVPAARRKAAGREKRELKPGFCENCREKFDDFEEVS
jgi:regulatory subunit for Cdc7p protein kinase